MIPLAGRWKLPTKSGCPQKVWAVIRVGSLLSGRKGKDGTGGSMTEDWRETSFMYTAAFVFQHRAWKKNHSHLSFRFHNVQVWRKKEVCGAADDRGRTVRIAWIPEQHCRQDTEVSSHLCLFHFLLFQGESHYSSLASRGRLTINRDKHRWPLTYPWQWPSAEQNQTLASASNPPGSDVEPRARAKWHLVKEMLAHSGH